MISPTHGKSPLLGQGYHFSKIGNRDGTGENVLGNDPDTIFVGIGRRKRKTRR